MKNLFFFIAVVLSIAKLVGQSPMVLPLDNNERQQEAIAVKESTSNSANITSQINPEYPRGTLHCGETPTKVIEVTNPATGRTWMDRNLGASQVATSPTDSAAYGDLYQWGRFADGHQCRTSPTTTILAENDTPNHNKFIVTPGIPDDWRSTRSTRLWQELTGANNPCPSGFRLPTETELETERLSWNDNNSEGAFGSPLKLTAGGNRNPIDGTLFNVGFFGNYWSSTSYGSQSRRFSFFKSYATFFSNPRSNGFSVRCIKEAGIGENLPNVTTSPVVVVSSSLVTGGGFVTNDGGASIEARGLVWSSQENPTLQDNDGMTSDGTGTGQFESKLTQLQPGQAYQSRAYATNKQGTAYGQTVKFTPTSLLPVVKTMQPTNITTTSAIAGGIIYDDGGLKVSSRGLVWSTFENPTVDNNQGITIEGKDTGEFSSTLTGLKPDMTYYARAYATNIEGSIYGQQIEFTTTSEHQPKFPDGVVHCNNTPTDVVEVFNPSTGKIWMDRNMGASQVATSSTDENAFGDLYQWGRFADGHQCRTSTTTSMLSSADTPNHGMFVVTNSIPWDWRSPANNSLWQGSNGANNPCPEGFRIPTDAELAEEMESWASQDASGAFTSPLKWILAGLRSRSIGAIYDVGSDGNYWSSTVDDNGSRRMFFGGNNAVVNTSLRAFGLSVRCIKD